MANCYTEPPGRPQTSTAVISSIGCIVDQACETEYFAYNLNILLGLFFQIANYVTDIFNTMCNIPIT